MITELRHPAWRKSSYSTTAANCVEVAALGWRTSEANCVEVALGWPAIGVRDSKHPYDPILAVPTTHWSTFLRGIPTPI